MSLVLEALEKAQRQAQNVMSEAGPLTSGYPCQSMGPARPGLAHHQRSSHKVLIFNLILFAAIINLVFLRWWLNRNNTEISVNIPPIIHSTPTPRFNVTGIVWDEKEPIVLVNGKFLKKGQEILGARLIDIQPHEARFLRGNEELSFSVE